MTFSECSLNSLNCSGISVCHTARTIAHTPANQDGRATPSPEHVPTADGEEMHSFDDNNYTSVSRETRGGFTRTVSNSNAGPTTTNNARNSRDTEQTDQNFNSFNYWRSPLPDISGELEMLNSETSEAGMEKKAEEEKPDYPDAKLSPGKATSDQIQKVLDCLQPHMDDPDVQGGCRDASFAVNLFVNESARRLSCACLNPPAQVQVLSAALKAAQLDGPDDDGLTEPEEQPEDDAESPSVESKSAEVQAGSKESPTEEEQAAEPPPASESSPVQEQGDEETQTEPLDDQEESPPDSPIQVRDSA